MLLGPLIFLAVLTLVHHPLMVSDNIDLATLNRIQDHEKRMQQEMEHLKTEFDQKGWTLEALRAPKDWITTDQPMDDESLNVWHYAIILFFLACYIYASEKEPSDDSNTDTSSSTSGDDDDDDTDMEIETCGNMQKALEAFYDRHTNDLSDMCDFVTSFVNDLLEACWNDLSYQNSLSPLANCIGIDSAFEGWHTQESKAFSVLVPIMPPKGHSFHVETSDSDGTSSKHGHILVEMECMCKRERLLGDVVCFLHHPEQQLSEDKQGTFFIHALCTSSHLDVDKTIHWFQSLVKKALTMITFTVIWDSKRVPSPEFT